MSEFTLEQMKENRRLWVEALRSGKYKQGTHALRSSDDRYCCLGVLCDIAGVEWGRHSSELYRAGYDITAAPAKAVGFVGLTDRIGGFGEGCDALASWNDFGANFAEIADLIESNPPGLFIESMEEAR